MAKTLDEIKTWLKTPEKILRILIEITNVTDVSGNTVTNSWASNGTIYLSNGAFTSSTSDNPANKSYLPIVLTGVDFSQSLSSSGEISVTYGDIEIDNFDGKNDTIYSTMVFTKKPITIYLGDPNWSKSDFKVLFRGIVADVVAKDRNTINIIIGDKLQYLDTTLSEDTILQQSKGNTLDLKPVTFGECFNITPLINQVYNTSPFNSTSIPYPNNSISILEGGTVDFLVTTVLIPDGTILWWSAFSDVVGVTLADILNPSPPIGSITIYQNSAIISIKIATDLQTPETGESFFVKLFNTELNMLAAAGSVTGNQSGQPGELAISNTVTIINSQPKVYAGSTFSIRSDITQVQEDETFTLTLETRNVDAGSVIDYSLLSNNAGVTTEFGIDSANNQFIVGLPNAPRYTNIVTTLNAAYEPGQWNIITNPSIPNFNGTYLIKGKEILVADGIYWLDSRWQQLYISTELPHYLNVAKLSGYSVGFNIDPYALTGYQGQPRTTNQKLILDAIVNFDADWIGINPYWFQIGGQYIWPTPDTLISIPYWDFVCTQTFSSTNEIAVSGTSGISINQKVMFSSVFGGITQNIIYYIKEINTSTNRIKISSTSGGSAVALTNAGPNTTSATWMSAAIIVDYSLKTWQTEIINTIKQTNKYIKLFIQGGYIAGASNAPVNELDIAQAYVDWQLELTGIEEFIQKPLGTSLTKLRNFPFPGQIAKTSRSFTLKPNILLETKILNIIGSYTPPGNTSQIISYNNIILNKSSGTYYIVHNKAIEDIVEIRDMGVPIENRKIDVTAYDDYIFRYSNHGLLNGTAVTLTNIIFISSGLTINTKYYIINATTNTFQLANSSGSNTFLTYTISNGTFGTVTINAESAYSKDLANGRFRLNQATFGQLTCTVQGDKTNNSYTNKIASTIKNIVKNYGPISTRFTDNDIDLTNFTNFDNTNNVSIGYYASDRKNLLEVCNELASSVRAKLLITVGPQINDSDVGKLRLVQLNNINGNNSVKTITSADIEEFSIRISDKPPIRAATKLAYCKNWTVQTSGLAQGLPAKTRLDFGEEWYYQDTIDNDVKSVYKLTNLPEAEISYLIVDSDASYESSTRNTLWKTQRFIYTFTGYAHLFDLQIGDIVKLSNRRFNLNETPGIIVSTSRNWIAGRIELGVLV